MKPLTKLHGNVPIRGVGTDVGRSPWVEVLR